MTDALERAARAAEEAMRNISVCESADGMSYALIDAVAEARCEKELSGAGDVLRDASGDVAHAALRAFLDADEAMVEKVARAMRKQRMAVSGLADEWQTTFSAYDRDMSRAAIAALREMLEEKK